MNLPFSSSFCHLYDNASSNRLFPLPNLKATNLHLNFGMPDESNHRSIIPCSSTNRVRVSALKSAAVGNDATSPAKSLRRLLEAPGIHLGPACFDALSAKLVERAGFDFCFTTGIFFCPFSFLWSLIELIPNFH